MNRVYIFHIRPWNIKFYQYLELELKKENSDVRILWFCMTSKEASILKKNAKEVFYLPSLLDSLVTFDEFSINEFENYMNSRFGFGLHFLFNQERFKPKHIDGNEWIKKHLNLFLTIIPKESITIALSCDHFVYILSGYVAEYLEGKSIYVQPVGIPCKAQVIMGSPDKILKFRNSELDKSFFNEYLDSLDFNPMVNVGYMIPKKNLTLYSSLKKYIKKLHFLSFKLNTDYTYLDDNRLSLFPSRYVKNFKKRFKFSFVSLGELKEKKDDHKIFYFPLQFEPEMTILVYSNWFKSQLDIIRMVSQSLKFGDVLVLKENPKMINQRKFSFYKEISNFPNVVWINPIENSREIIRISSKVISITGTAAVEAAFLGVNSLLFGYAPFKDLLIEEMIENQPVSNFSKILYSFYTKDEISENLINNWSEYSKALIIENFIPEYVNSEFTLVNPEGIANNFYHTVLKSDILN
jgi:hypothetical protein